MHAQVEMMFPELTALTDQPAASLEMEQAFGSLMDGEVLSVFTRSFAQMEIAEEEIQRFQERHPERAAAIQKTFLPLRWMLNEPAPEPVFRHHVQELLQRVVDDVSLSPGTRAEALIAFHVTSLKAPLTSEAMIVAIDLFRQIYGDLPSVTDHGLKEPWPGAGDELLAGLYRKLSQDRHATQ
jgi:hypothetical protein